MGQKVDVLSYEQVTSLIGSIADAVKAHVVSFPKGEDGNSLPIVIYAPIRGGLVPGVVLSHMLDTQNLRCVNMSGWKISASPMSHIPILIDDILDTGKTITTCLDRFRMDRPHWKSPVLVSALICKERVAKAITELNLPWPVILVPGKIVPSNHPWVVFPWEKQP